MKHVTKSLTVIYISVILFAVCLGGCLSPDQVSETANKVTDPNGVLVTAAETAEATANAVKEMLDTVPLPNSVKAPIADVLDIIAIAGALLGGGAAAIFKKSKDKMAKDKHIADIALVESVVGIELAKKNVVAKGLSKDIITDGLRLAQHSVESLKKIKEIKAEYHGTRTS